MEEQKQNDKTCGAGCGFYGSSATNGLCSLCYKQQLARSNAAPTPASPTAPQGLDIEPIASARSAVPAIITAQQSQDEDQNPEAGTSERGTGGSSTQLGQQEEPTERPESAETPSDLEGEGGGSTGLQKKSQTRRCATCRKKVGLAGFECRCGKLFCGTHRYSDMHNCSFDYREYGRNEIQKNNPVVVAEKIKKL